MAINTPVDPMAELEAWVNTEDTKTATFAPFFFSIKDGQKALIRPLLNFGKHVRVDKHEVYNNGTKQYEVKAVCASSMPLDGCFYCEQAKTNKKLAITPQSGRIVLPIYVHAVLDSKTGKPIMYTDKDGKEQPIKGVRLLEMKRSSTILADLMNSYKGTDDHETKPQRNDISTIDYVIKREGEGLDTRYVVTPKSPRALPADDIPAWTRDRDQVLLQYADACPFKLVDEDATTPAVSTASQNGNASKGKSHIDDDF